MTGNRVCRNFLKLKKNQKFRKKINSFRTKKRKSSILSDILTFIIFQAMVVLFLNLFFYAFYYLAYAFSAFVKPTLIHAVLSFFFAVFFRKILGFSCTFIWFLFFYFAYAYFAFSLFFLPWAESYISYVLALGPILLLFIVHYFCIPFIVERKDTVRIFTPYVFSISAYEGPEFEKISFS